MRLEDLQGRRIGRYQIVGLLGRGGMAAVYRAHDAALRRDVALKVLYPQYGGDRTLTDFGLVKAVESSVIARSTMGSSIGTAAYIAPEVWEGSATTDVYALGCVLFEMLTGELLFKGSTPSAVMLAHFRLHEYPAQWPRVHRRRLRRCSIRLWRAIQPTATPTRWRSGTR